MRLIDADELLELYANTDDLDISDYDVKVAVIRQNILDMPTIDIVRCGECMYYEESEYIEGDMACTYHIRHTYYTEADRYCYYGERRE